MDFQVTIEQPQDIKTKQSYIATREFDEFAVGHLAVTTFVYDVKAKSEKQALPLVRTALVHRIKQLRKQGLRITTPQLMKADLLIERVG